MEESVLTPPLMQLLDSQLEAFYQTKQLIRGSQCPPVLSNIRAGPYLGMEGSSTSIQSEMDTKKTSHLMNRPVEDTATHTDLGTLHKQSGEKSPVHVQGGEKSPVHVQGGEKSPVHVQGGEKSPVHIQGGGKSPMHDQGKESPIPEEPADGVPVKIEAAGPNARNDSVEAADGTPDLPWFMFVDDPLQVYYDDMKQIGYKPRPAPPLPSDGFE